MSPRAPGIAARSLAIADTIAVPSVRSDFGNGPVSSTQPSTGDPFVEEEVHRVLRVESLERRVTTLVRTKGKGTLDPKR